MGAKTTREIAAFIHGFRYGELPPEVLSYAKILALSHLGMNVAGSTMESGRQIVQYVEAKGGTAEAGVFGAGFRTSVDNAALANGNSAHATELEDVSYPEATYSCGHWPAVLALGEKLRLSGKDIIEALIAGYEVAARLGMAYQAGLLRGRAHCAAMSTIGSAASVAKLLRLSEDRITSAISIAASQASGLIKQNGTGAHTVEAGFGGRNGVCAAELAAIGCTGSPIILEGKGGFGDIWSDCPDFELPLEDDYRLMRVGIKKYPSCFGTQRNIDAVLDLVSEHGIRWEDVAEINHGVNSTRAAQLKFSQPTTGEEARFSLQHCSVACFFDKEVFLQCFTDGRARDPQWQEARKKVTVTEHPEWPAGFFTFDSPVTITMTDGTRFAKLAHDARGDPDRRFGVGEVTRKYLQCMSFAGNFSRSRIEQVGDMTLSLDELDDVSKLARIVTFPDLADPGPSCAPMETS